MEPVAQRFLPAIETKVYRGEPFIKWAGGKTQLLPSLNKYFPKEFNSYYEPFMGGLSVFFYLRRTRGDFPAWLSDYNAELVMTAQIIRDEVDSLIPLLQQHQSNHGKKYYYQIRAQQPDDLTGLQRAARFIYLNKTCFNGLYRVNTKGQFNVPIGSAENPRIFDEDNLRSTSDSLQDTTIVNQDFSTVTDMAKEGDLVYFDPPYHSEDNGFTGYIVGTSGRAIFGPREQRRLATVVDQLTERGCYVVLSNSSTPFIKQLYHDYNIHIVKARRAINSNGNGRGPVDEVLVTNFA